MSDASSPPYPTCAECGALLQRDVERCWLCDAPVHPPAPANAPAPSGSTSPFDVASPFDAASPRAHAAPHREGSFSLATLMIVTTLVAVCCGLFLVAPGLAVTVCILIAPVLVRTAMVVRRREAAGRSVSLAERAALVVGSLVVAHVILAVVLVAAVGSFCAVCLSAGTEKAIPVAILVAAVPTVAVIALMVRWIRSRFRRAVENP